MHESRGVPALAAEDGAVNDLMHVAIEKEFALTTDDVAKLKYRISLLRRTLSGMATNATACKMCQLHNEIYEDALERDDSLTRAPMDVENADYAD